MNLDSKVYDFLNSLVRLILPAAATLYFALSEVWNWPYAVEVMATIVALEVFLGLVIQLARAGWKQDTETIWVDASAPDQTSFGFESGIRLEELSDGEEIVAKVKRVDGESRGTF